MSFATYSAPVAYAFICAVALTIWLLYLIKPRKQRVAAASTLVWRRVLTAMPTRRTRWRWLLSLLLALGIGLSLVLALTRPQLHGLDSAPQRIVVILDNAASMAARTHDGRTRWQHAQDGARRVIQEAGAGSEILLLDTAGRARLAGFLPPSQALQQLTTMAPSPDASTRVPPLPAGAGITRTYLFTDGVGLSTVPSGIALRSVFEPADNIGITAFAARPVPADPTRYTAVLQVTNAAAIDKPVALEIAGASGFRLQRQLHIAGAATVNLTLDVTDFAQGPLRAQITVPGDALELDDVAYCVVAPHRTRRVVLVTGSGGALEDSLRALPGIALVVRPPADASALPSADAYVFDGNAPRDPPAAGALLFRPPAAAWLRTQWQPVGQALAASSDDLHPLSAGVDWHALRLQRALLARPAEAAATIVSGRTAGAASASGALIVAGYARARWIAVGFAPADSNFPLQPGFPIFLGSALSWLTQGPAIAGEGLGRIEVPVAGGHVLEGGARRVGATATPHGTLFEASRPGVYVVDNGVQQLVVVANAIDPRLVQINQQQLHEPGSADGASTPRRSWPEPSIWLLALGFALLTVEWFGFSRRITE